MEDSRALTSGRWKYIRNDKPEIPYDAGQAYLEFYRPAVHSMRVLRDAGKLTPEQAFFFLPTKPGEELYDLENDPEELHNLVEVAAHQRTLRRLRKITKRYDRKMKPVSDVYHPVHPGAVDVLAYIKKEKPALYQRMLAGEEIGFGKSRKLYLANKQQ
jgi:arylsulfatase A-like enzyme